MDLFFHHHGEFGSNQTVHANRRCRSLLFINVCSSRFLTVKFVIMVMPLGRLNFICHSIGEGSWLCTRIPLFATRWGQYKILNLKMWSNFHLLALQARQHSVPIKVNFGVEGIGWLGSSTPNFALINGGVWVLETRQCECWQFLEHNCLHMDIWQYCVFVVFYPTKSSVSLKVFCSVYLFFCVAVERCVPLNYTVSQKTSHLWLAVTFRHVNGF